MISKNSDSQLKVNTTKEYVFDAVIRTVKIEAEKPMLQCVLKVKGKNNMPVLFSDNDFVVENSNEASFLIPYEPPSKMEFSYGETGLNNSIVVTAIYSDYTMERIELEIK